METQADERRFDQFSPRRILMLVNQAIRYLRSKWIVIVVTGILLGLVAVIYSYPVRPQYTAEFSFAMDEGGVKTQGNSLTRLSEELGFSPSFEAGGIFSSMSNIIELMQSRLLIEKTLKRSVVLYGKPVIFANFFLDSLRYREKWMKNPNHPKLDFSDTTLSREEELYRNGIINNMHSVITSKLMKIDTKGKGTSLIDVTLISENELFSKYFLEALVDEVSKYYISLKTYRSKLYLEFIQKRTDSVKNAYMASLFGRANFSDANLNPILQTNIVPGERKQTDVVVLRETYIGLVKNLESARTSLLQDTPLFQYLDQPVLPLKIKAGSLLMKFILFFIVGMVLASLFVMLRKFYRFLMSREY